MKYNNIVELLLCNLGSYLLTFALLLQMLITFVFTVLKTIWCNISKN